MDRTGGMGSTDVAEILGLSPYEGAGPWHVWRQKAGVETDNPTAEMRWGHEIEAMLVDWWGRTQGVGVHHFKGDRIKSKREPWLWASPDACEARMTNGLIDKFLECKNVGSWMAHRWITSDPDGIPDDVRIQVTIGMFCCEVDRWTVIAAIGGLPPVVYRIEYDQRLAKLAIERAREFWERFQRGEHPPIDGSDDCAAYLRARYPRDELPTILASEKQEELAHERVSAHAMGKANAARKKEIDALFMADMGPHGRLQGLGWHVTWKTGPDGKRRMRFTGGGLDE